ncbi:reverse transcriptase domain-containing protein [Tanacetum coccineum]
MVNDTCKDSFKRFTDVSALVCLPPPEDADDEKEKQEEGIFHLNKTPQVSLVFAITSTLPSIEPKDSLITGDEHLSTFSVEEIVPIPREYEDTFGSDNKNILPSCDDFSSINVPRDDFVTFSNPLFEFDVNFNSSDINPLFDNVLEDIECKDSYDSNLDEPTFLVTPISDSNKDECLAPGDDIEILLHHDPSTPMKSVTKLNEATRKDHFLLPFMDQMLERLAGNEFYCFLNGFSGYFQIPLDPQDQEKTTFTCPYGTFAYRRMPFGLCNAPGTFQRCMMAIFHDMIEKTIEVFMDDFSVFGDSFDLCLSNLEKMLKRCEDTNLVLN